MAEVVKLVMPDKRVIDIVDAYVRALIPSGASNSNKLTTTKDTMPRYRFVTAAIADGVVSIMPYTSATLVSDGTPFEVAVAEGDGKMRDCMLVVDCTSLGAAPTITWPSNFHPRTDAETDFACAAGVRNVYWITEYEEGQFAVAGWQETAGSAE